MLKEIKPRNARTRRALEKREPQLVEHVKQTLILRGSSSSEIVQLALADLHTLKRPHCVKFSKKNDIRPFEDASSLEFLAEKNDVALLVLGHHSKKRPHSITLIRCFDNKILDMLELHINADTFRTINQFKNKKCGAGLKPLLAFSGTVFDSPLSNGHTLAKSLLVELFRGQEVSSVEVEGLQYLIHFTAADEVEGQPAPTIHMRVYLLRTKTSGQKLPRIEVEEMGPRLDFRVGRRRDADSTMLKEALKVPKQLEMRQKKNIETDLVGDKLGRIHMGKQNLNNLQTRKMKGLKRGIEDVNGTDVDTVDEDLDSTANSKRVFIGDEVTA